MNSRATAQRRPAKYAKYAKGGTQTIPFSAYSAYSAANPSDFCFLLSAFCFSICVHLWLPFPPHFSENSLAHFATSGHLLVDAESG